MARQRLCPSSTATKLAFTWVWDDRSNESLIEIDFEEVEGRTEVSFTHSGLLDEESMRSHQDGWGKAFANLERALAES